MEQRKPNRRPLTDSTATESLLANYYGQLLKWALTLTRGDVFKAQDIVQELCLYFTLTRPDLREIANVNGYLYTCLRHIYTSSMARASREALRFVSVADFDSIEAAMASAESHDRLQRQNDLRRICFYAIWRKESSKIASYFILHYFHGYSRCETADVACVPLSAIYNKLKLARSEVKSHLEDASKLRVVGRNAPVPVSLSKTVSNSVDFFHELRQCILKARTSDCLPESELLAHYESSRSLPIDCALLAHIVSCERCLAIVDRHFRRPTLADRESLDALDVSHSTTSSGNKSTELHAVFTSLRKRSRNVFEHRPNSLSIALNGKVVASHNVHGAESSLSARIDSSNDSDFVEVFSEQNVRLAYLAIEARPPVGPGLLSQRVSLSDNRWLELALGFDGFGLNAEVTYFDPVLASEASVTDEDAVGKELPSQTQSVGSTPSHEASRIRRLLESIARPVVLRWSFALALLASAVGYFNHHRAQSSVTPDEILNQSAAAEAVNLRGQVLHQTLRLEETFEDMKVVRQDTVELWKEGDGNRSIRRLYDAQDKLIALAWRNREGDLKTKDFERTLNGDSLLRDYWESDLSATTFRQLASDRLEVVRHAGETALTTVGTVKQHPEIISARLILDDKLTPIRQEIRIHTDTGIREVHLIQTNYERRPSMSVPDSLFEPSSKSRRSEWTIPGPTKRTPQAKIEMSKIAPLQIAVLYQLNLLGVDMDQPIKITPLATGRIQVIGTIANSELRQKVLLALQHIDKSNQLEVSIPSGGESKLQLDNGSSTRISKIYEMGQGTPLVDTKVRQHFMNNGLTGHKLDAAVAGYDDGVLRHTQRALQNAYALNRLGEVLSTSDLGSLPVVAKQQWAVMAENHASDLKEQLHALETQLQEIEPLVARKTRPGGSPMFIENLSDFARVSHEQLQSMQQLEHNVGDLLTSTGAVDSSSDIDALLGRTMSALPVQEANDIAKFATTLNSSSKAAMVAPQR